MVHGHSSSVRFVSLTYVPFDQDGAGAAATYLDYLQGVPLPRRPQVRVPKCLYYYFGWAGLLCSASELFSQWSDGTGCTNVTPAGIAVLQRRVVVVGER